MRREPGLYWAQLNADGGGFTDELTVVEIDGDGDIWRIGSEEPLAPDQVRWCGTATPPRGSEC